uniref:PX domain-containing protein n=1 Tax=Anopheles funestus TaxID=62324 RepID=A0A182RCL4_ANOFN
MSLRAIQKRDREKLSSSQRQQQQQQQQFISHQWHGSASGVGAMLVVPNAATQLTAAAMKMTAATGRVDVSTIVVPSVQSILQHQHAKRKQTQAAYDVATGLMPVTTHAPTVLRRSSSYPTLSRKRSRKQQQQQLRPIRSTSDLSALHDLLEGGTHSTEPEFIGGGVGVTGSANSFSTNNLYLGAKSEVCLKTLAVKNTVPTPFVKPGAAMQQSLPPTGGSIRSASSSGSASATQPSSKRLYESRRTSELSSSDFGPNKSEIHLKANTSAVRIPIVGYEVMEERARFTIFKLRIENSISHTCWLVLRRYTDFVRLNNKLRTIYPHCNLVLPRKKWFGDNFSSGFIDNRIQGLQTFINTILGDDVMRTCQAVRDFFCLDEPPSYSESMEESRVIFEAQEETIAQLKQQLQAKDDMVQVLQTKLATELNRNAILTNVIRSSVENCAKCSKSVDQVMKDSVYK